MDINRVIFEYGKAQLHILMIQEQLQALNAKVAELTKQLAPKDGEVVDTKTPEVPTEKVEVKRRGRPRATAQTVVEKSVTAEDLQAAL